MKGAGRIGSAGHARREGDERTGNNIALTPQWLITRIREDVFGGTIDFDPCTTPDNPVGATRFITPPEDGILQPWEGRCYVNPPYGTTLKQWAARCALAGAQGCSVVMLVPCRPDVGWFHESTRVADDVLLVRGRLNFQPDKKSNAPFPSALFGFGISLEPLRDLGTIIRPVSTRFADEDEARECADDLEELLTYALEKS